ncbi:hypothetical protein ACSBR2_034606 [Camellia fascicularis]
MNISLSTWLFLFITLSINLDLVPSQCLDHELLTLLKLKQGLTFDTYLFSSKLKSKLKSWNSSTDCCSWAGVTCNDSHVIGLDLSSESISGGIGNTSDLFDLQYLQSLNLANNFFNTDAQIPSGNCQLFGTLSKKIIKLPTLQTLDLSDNGLLEGPLSEFPQKTSFQTHLLGYTNFSGKLPNSIGNLEGLSILILGSCNFTGPIPNSLVNLTQLGNLDLSFNMFTGPIPSFPKNLFDMDLFHNDLSGRIPFTHFEGLRNLVDINLCHNSFKGNIPLSLFTLSSLQIIDLPFNQFEGQIAEFPNASSSSLAFLDMSSNKLEGSVPMSFFELRSLTVLDLSSNNFSGIMQLEMIQTLHQLRWLDLSYNGLSIETNGSYSSLPLSPRSTH